MKLGFKYGFGLGSFFNKEMAITYTSVRPLISNVKLGFKHELSKAQPKGKPKLHGPHKQGEVQVQCRHDSIQSMCS